MTNTNSWWTAEHGEAHTRVMTYVAAVERNQFDLFNRFEKCAALYDPNGSRGISSMPWGSEMSLVTENVIASAIDAAMAQLSATDVRARFETDDADWSTQRRARWLEWYAEQLSVTFSIDQKCREAFRDCAIKGTGVLKVFADEHGIHINRIQVDDIIVDELECRAGIPKQLHQRMSVDRDELKTLFPENEDEIDKAPQSGGSTKKWAGFRPVEDNSIIVVESWRLPIGKMPKDAHGNSKASKRYIPGRHTICIEGCTLLDESWDKTQFPFVTIRWSPRINGWYGISLAERIAGHQNTLNRRNKQIDRQLTQGAFPTTYVPMGDANIAARPVNAVGTVVPYKVAKPETVIPQAVSNETYQSVINLKNSAFEESGISRMAAQATKPAGIDSGVAMREYRDQTTQRFALQEKSFELFKLDAIVALLEVCKELGADAPVMMRKSRFGRRRIEWSKVEIPDVKVMIAAASTLPRTPAGRQQMVVEWAQAGIVSQDDARRLMQHPDLDSAMSLHTAAVENIEEMFERICDGEIVTPEPFQNLKLLTYRGTMFYMKIQGDGAPENILEALRATIVQASYILSGGSQPANSNVAPAQMPQVAAPTEAPPQAALAAQAMNLRAV